MHCENVLKHHQNKFRNFFLPSHYNQINIQVWPYTSRQREPAQASLLALEADGEQPVDWSRVCLYINYIERKMNEVEFNQVGSVSGSDPGCFSKVRVGFAFSLWWDPNLEHDFFSTLIRNPGIQDYDSGRFLDDLVPEKFINNINYKLRL